MLKTEREKRTCSKYSERDADGFVHCNDCPLIVDRYNILCKAVAHYDRHKREWVIDLRYKVGE